MSRFSPSPRALLRPEPRLQLWLGFGLSLILLALLLVVFLAPELFQRQTLYRTDFTDVSGLRPGAEISYAGFPVGRVRAVEPRFDQGRFVVTLGLDPAWVRPAGIVAQIDESNPLRPATIVLRQDPACPRVEAAPGVIPGCGRQPNVFDLAGQVVGDAARIVEQVGGMLAGGQDGGASQELMAKVQRTLDNVEAITASVRGLTDEQRMAVIAGAVDDLAATTAAARRTLENSTRIDPEQINRSIAAVERTTTAMGDLLRDNSASLTVSASEARFLLQASAPSLQQILLNLEEASRNLGDLSARLRDDPAMFIRGRGFSDPGEIRESN